MKAIISDIHSNLEALQAVLADVKAQGITEVYSVTGDIDLIAVARVSRHEEFADVIADRLNKVEGVLETNTHIAFRTYSAEDLDAGFALGLDGQ